MCESISVGLSVFRRVAVYCGEASYNVWEVHCGSLASRVGTSCTSWGFCIICGVVVEAVCGAPSLERKSRHSFFSSFPLRPSLSLSPLLSFVFSLPHAATWFKRQGGYKLDTPMTMPSVPVRPIPRVISVLPDQGMLVVVVVPMPGQGMAVPSASGGAIIAQQPSSYTLPEPAAEPLSGSAVDWLSADAAQELVPAVVALPGGRNVSTPPVAPPVDPLAGAPVAVEDWTGFPAGTFREPH